ncbi:MAG: hypothetical protein DDT32_01714 [Syntrophomonadaceae bacterium]|nr:hypothetical protein [Bacillota bacterium]
MIPIIMPIRITAKNSKTANFKPRRRNVTKKAITEVAGTATKKVKTGPILIPL